MKIALDANEANVAEKVGTGEYTYRILSHWAAHSQHHFDLFLKRPPRPDLPPPTKNWQYHVTGSIPGWTRFVLPTKLAFRSHQVFFSPAHYLPPYTGSPSVVTVHDLAYEYFPSLFLRSDLYKLKRWTRHAVQQATRVIAVSKSTKQDLTNLYQLDPDKISVIPNGYNHDLFNTTSRLSRAILRTHNLTSGKYLLFLGTLQPRKNVIKLIQAFRLLREEGYSGKLVLAGKVGWLAEETLQVINNSPDKKHIIMTGYVSESARRTLYRHADVFILPSLYEGFGVPVLEAMASGCPVAASDNSSLPEVVGKAGILFNPTDPADIARAVTQLKENRSNYIKKGLSQAKKFSWSQSADLTLQVIKTAASKSQK